MIFKYKKDEFVKLPDGTRGKILVRFRNSWYSGKAYVVEAPSGSERVQIFREKELKDDK